MACLFFNVIMIIKARIAKVRQNGKNSQKYLTYLRKFDKNLTCNMHDFGRRTWSRRKDPANARWAQDRIMSRAQHGLTFF